MLKLIFYELKEHAFFTIFGALTGAILIVVFKNIPHETAYNAFYVLHPMHVFLSALVTASMYEKYECGHLKRKCNVLILLAVGYFGSIGVTTISDSIIPYIGETLLNMPHREVHAGFIDKWWLVNPLALAGIAVAYFRPTTKAPHAGHVLISTWASLFHIVMAANGSLNLISYIAIFVFLFLAVWLPCCISDIIFPLLFIKGDAKKCEHSH